MQGCLKIALLVVIIATSTVRSDDVANALNQLESGLGAKYQTAHDACVASNNCKGTLNSVRVNMGRVASAFTASTALAKGFSDLNKQGAWSSVASKIGKLAPFLSAAAPLLSIIGTFSKSPERQLLEEVISTINTGFEKIDGRFDAVEAGLQSVENKVQQQHFWTQLNGPLNDLNSINKRVQLYLATDDFDARESQGQSLDDGEYESLFNAISAIEDKFNGANDGVTLCQSVREFSNVDLKTVLQVAGDLYERMLRGMQNYQFIGALNGRQDVDYMASHWEGVLSGINEKIQKCENDIKSTYWKQQWKQEIEPVAEDFGAGKEQQVAKAIYDKLSNKYYFVDWMVVVYAEMRGSGNHYWQTCGLGSGSTVQYPHWRDDYNILVSWVPKSRSKAFSTRRQNQLQNTVTIISDPNTFHQAQFEPVETSAKSIYDVTPSFVRSSDCICMLKGVMKEKTQGDFKAFAAPGRQIAIRKSGLIKHYWLYCLG